MLVTGRYVAIAILVGATSALAHTGATGIVKERMDGMDALAESMKSLVKMSKSGEIVLDQVREAAMVIQSHSGTAMTARFPEGSLPEVSEASPAIWTDWDGFSEISNELRAVAVSLEKATYSESLDLGGFIKQLGDTCSACHGQDESGDDARREHTAVKTNETA